MKPLKVKIIGSGNAAQKHAAAFQSLPELYQITESDDHSIVDVCTINSLHYQQACDALRSGRHAIVEKPVCGSLAEIEAFSRLEQETGKRICPVSQYRFAGHESVKGPIVTHWQRDPTYYAGWRGNADEALGGCLITHGIHSVDLMLSSHGMPDKVEMLTFKTGPGHLETECTLAMSWHDTTREIEITVSPEPPAKRIFELGNSDKGFAEQFRRIHDAIITGRELPVSLNQAKQALTVVTAAYYSASTGEPVTLPIETDHPYYSGWAQTFQPKTELPSPRSQASRKTPAQPDDPTP